jgi:hypothetical protein
MKRLRKLLRLSSADFVLRAWSDYSGIVIGRACFPGDAMASDEPDSHLYSSLLFCSLPPDENLSNENPEPYLG